MEISDHIFIGRDVRVGGKLTDIEAAAFNKDCTEDRQAFGSPIRSKLQ